MRPVRNVFQKLSRTEQRREGVVAYLWLAPFLPDPFPNFLSFLTLQREERIDRCLGLLLFRKGLSRARANLVLAANAHFPVPEIFREYIAN